MGFLKKIFKPISRVLDKVIPNEIKPALPYVAAFAPYLLGPGIMGSSMGMRALSNSALNAIGQLSQEGNEGELNALSLLLAAGQGAGTAEGAGSRLRGFKTKGTPQEIARGNVPGMSGGFEYDTSGLTGLQKAKNFSLEGLANLSDKLGGARDTLQGVLDMDPTKANLEKITAAGATPFSQATGDLAYAQGVKQEKEFNRNQAREAVEAEMRQRGLDQEYIDAITSSMTAYGYTQADIDAILELRGYATGGRVGYSMGGDIMQGIMSMISKENKDPDFSTMAETVETVEMQPKEYLFDNKLKFEVGPGENEQMSILNALFADEEGIIPEDRKQEYYNSYINQLYRSGEIPRSDYNGYIEEGILTKPKYNMGGSVLPQGMEMDYRQGGMIPMGSAERADDVPARVSKNEFVMTADAVRAAGGGSVNKGAQRMYQLMNNLEAKA